MSNQIEPTKERNKEIQFLMDELEHATNSLIERVDLLEGDLIDILAPSEVPHEKSKNDASRQTVFGNRLEMFLSRVEAVNNKLADIRSRSRI